jgi:tellurite resistance protein TerC
MPGLMFEATAAGWAVTLAAIGALIAFDLWQSRAAAKAVGLSAAVRWSLFYLAVAGLFGVVLALLGGWPAATQYFAGYVVERSLSIDNLFVFVIIMATFAVPAAQQARLLMTGIVGALVLRGIFIVLGAALLHAFSPTYLLFGLILLVTAVQLLRNRDREPSVESNPVVAAARQRRLPPALLALVAIATTDFVFALDSIPAVFGVTQHTYIVFTANAFALLGLRPLFFLVSGLLDRLVYLSVGLAAVLAFIGVKLVLEFAHIHHDDVPQISTGVSLGVIAAILTSTTVASLLKVRLGGRSLGGHAGSRRRGPGDEQARAIS